jgi:hypothetical protein
MCLTQQVTGGELSGAAIAASHEEAASALRNDRSSYLLFTSLDEADKLAQLFEAEFDPAVVQKVCADFASNEGAEADLVARAIADIIDQLPADCLAKLAERVVVAKTITKANLALKLTPSNARQMLDKVQAVQVIMNQEPTNASRLLLGVVLGRSTTSARTGQFDVGAFHKNYSELKPVWDKTLARFTPLWDKLSV